MSVPTVNESFLENTQTLIIENDGEVNSISLRSGQEYRFEVEFDSKIDVALKQGAAEIFGTEITIGALYNFTGTKAAVFSWQGCELEITGTPAVGYVSSETPMGVYLNCHFALDRLRNEALKRGQSGPRVMIVGPEDSGKTSLLRILSGYALKQDRAPILVNLDTREGMSTIPGTISAMSVSSILAVQDGFGTSATTGTADIAPKIPLVYFYGSDAPTTNMKYYKSLISRLAVAVASRLSENKIENANGLMIETAGVIDQKKGYEILQNVISDFAVDVVVVIGSERLYNDMIKKYDGQRGMTVIKVPKSVGVVGRESSYLRQVQRASFKRYFYGDARQNLSPFSLSVDFADMALFKVDEAQTLNTSLLPIDSLLAITHADSRESTEALSESPILGFVYVSDVDDTKQRVTLLSPFQGRLPAKGLILSSYKFQDS